MRRTPALWVASFVTLLVGSYAVRLYYPAKRPLQAAKRNANVARVAETKAESQEAAVTAAAPEDPGAVSVVGPLAVWMRDADSAQSEQPTAASGRLQPADHPVAAPSTAEQYLRVEFPLKKSAQFTFVIPPHTLSPRLHGSFSSSIRHSRAVTSNDAAKVDLAVMNAQQFDDYLHGRPADVTFELEASSRIVDFMLPAAYDQPQEYHLVFREAAAGLGLFVRADFSVNAE